MQALDLAFGGDGPYLEPCHARSSPEWLETGFWAVHVGAARQTVDSAVAEHEGCGTQAMGALACHDRNARRSLEKATTG